MGLTRRTSKHSEKICTCCFAWSRPSSLSAPQLLRSTAYRKRTQSGQQCRRTASWAASCKLTARDAMGSGDGKNAIGAATSELSERRTSSSRAMTHPVCAVYNQKAHPLKSTSSSQRVPTSLLEPLHHAEILAPIKHQNFRSVMA